MNKKKKDHFNLKGVFIKVYYMFMKKIARFVGVFYSSWECAGMDLLKKTFFTLKNP